MDRIFLPLLEFFLLPSSGDSVVQRAEGSRGGSADGPLVLSIYDRGAVDGGTAVHHNARPVSQSVVWFADYGHAARGPERPGLRLPAHWRHHRRQRSGVV